MYFPITRISSTVLYSGRTAGIEFVDIVIQNSGGAIVDIFTSYQNNFLLLKSFALCTPVRLNTD